MEGIEGRFERYRYLTVYMFVELLGLTFDCIEENTDAKTNGVFANMSRNIQYVHTSTKYMRGLHDRASF